MAKTETNAAGPSRKVQDIAADIVETFTEPDHATIIELDIALDDARRIVWVSTFSGKPVRKGADRYEQLDRIVSMVQGISAMEAVQVIECARLMAWGIVYGGDKTSAFGAVLDAWSERSAHPGNPKSLN